MARIEPPKLAAWMLEYLVPAAERDEALAGDLEEHYRAGRSDAWYWRQAAAAVATGWGQYLNRRRAILVFALLWSTLAPAWYSISNDIESSHDFGKAWEIFGPFMLVGWTALHAAFLWAGLMVYQLVNTFVGRPIPRKAIRRAFWIVPLVLPPVYGIIFVLSALYWNSISGLEHAKLAASSWGQIADFGILADLIRIPYFLTLTAALWGTAGTFRRSSPSADFTQNSGASLANPVPGHLDRFFAFVVAAGVINALLSGFLLCRLPASNVPSLSSLLLRAAIYVAIGAAAGTAGAWIYWNNPASPFRDSAPIDFRLFALACAGGWIWTPAFILLYEQVTAAVAFVAVIGAFALAAGLRTVPLGFQPAPASGYRQNSQPDDLFAGAFLRPQIDGGGIMIALAIYGGAYAIAESSFMTASLLLGLAAFLLGWMRTVQRREPKPHGFARAAVRLVIFVLPAISVTAWALLTGVAHRNHLLAVKAAEASDGARAAEEKAAAKSAAHGFGGYESVILWPFPEKKPIVAPLPLQDGPLAPGAKRPLVVQFDGPYWFLQPPDERPGPHAHQAHGSPLGVRIMANNSDPLVMIARQPLGQPIPLARCGQVEIELDNRDQNLGVVAVVLLLEDSSSKGHPQLDVGRQQIVTGEPETSGLQSFRFRLPARASLRRFETVAVMFLPESGHERVAPRFAVRELRFYPR